MSEEQIHTRVRGVPRTGASARVETKRPSELSVACAARWFCARDLIASGDSAVRRADDRTRSGDQRCHRDLILEMDSTLNSTTVSITHDMKVAFKIADRVAMLYNGHIVEQGTPYEFQQSRNPIVRQFIEGRADGR